jgi:HEAT repeat protein
MDTEVEVQLRALQSGDASLHAEAAQALGRIGDVTTIPLLMQAYHNSVEQVSEHVAEAIGRIMERSRPELVAALEDAFAHEQPPQTIPEIVTPSGRILLQALHNTEGFVLAFVIEALGRLGRSVVPGLLEALQDPDSLVRASVAQALGKIGDPVALPALMNLLQDRNGTARDCAAEAVGCYGLSVVPTLLEALRDPRRRDGAVLALARIGDPAVTPALLQAMHYGSEGSQWRLLQAFERIGPAARPYLLEAMQDPYEFTRASAATALGYIGDSSDVPVLLEALRDPGRFSRVRSSAAYALGRIRNASAIPALLEALQDNHPTVRGKAVQALCSIGEAGVVSDVIQVLGDSNLSVHEYAVNALAAMGSAVIPALQQALQNPNEAIRTGAATALLKIQEDTAPEDTEDIETWRIRLKDTTP